MAEEMAGLRIFLSVTLGVAFMDCALAFARPAFKSSEIEGEGAEVLFCDLDGDNLKDAVLIDGSNLSLFYQDSKQGFTRRSQQPSRLDDRPSLVWPARLGRDAESLLVLTSEGVMELYFTNRTGPPTRRQIIEQHTIIPDAVDELRTMPFFFSANTGTQWPVLLVPAVDGLQVWQHRGGWHRAQTITQAMDVDTRPSVANAGYTHLFGLSLNLSDVNGDGRDDLMVMRNVASGMQVYALHIQNADGLFASEPILSYTNQPDWRTALCWIDLNRDGKVDLIKSTFLDEPFFIPGMRSGKVLVAAYLADEHGRIAARPEQIFRKNDWSSALPVVDVDGDGWVDLILGHIPINSREGLRKAITAEQVDLNLKLYFSRSGASFPKDPDCQRDTLIHFQRMFFFTSERRLYYEQFINFNGDFNGDGKKDLLARDSSHWISVYFFVSREKGFSSKSDLRFMCPEPIDWWEVQDLNGDGLSDLIVKLRERKVFRMFTSQTK